jgi:hypothetical protein
MYRRVFPLEKRSCGTQFLLPPELKGVRWRSLYYPLVFHEIA